MPNDRVLGHDGKFYGAGNLNKKPRVKCNCDDKARKGLAALQAKYKAIVIEVDKLRPELSELRPLKTVVAEYKVIVDESKLKINSLNEINSTWKKEYKNASKYIKKLEDKLKKYETKK